jgi:predicted nucleic acid-binding protein
MTIRAGERLFCDTNVLLSAVDRRRLLHPAALRIVNDLPNQGVELCVSGQVLRECLVVSTRPVERNGLGLTLAAAVRNNETFAERTTILEETRGVARRLPGIVEAAECSGKRIHDANIAATMLEHGVTLVVTANPHDLMRFEGVEVIPLSEV